MIPVKECNNCANTLAENFKYCPECGQNTRLHRLSIHDVVHDALHYFTHADKGFLQLLKSLAFRTGVVAKEYVAGKRKKYFPPLNFFLLAATIYVLTISIAISPTRQDVSKAHPELNRIPDRAKREAVRQIYERQAKATPFIHKYSNIIAMIAVPLIGLIYWLFYKRAKYNYIEHLAACMYMTGFNNLIYAVILIPVSVLFGLMRSGNSLITLTLFIIFQVVYNAVFYYHFISKGSKLSALKATGVSLFAVLFWSVLSGFLVGLYIRNGFWGLLR